MNWEIRFDINTLTCVKQLASGKLLCSTGSSVQGSVMTWGWDEDRGGRDTPEGGVICIHIADSLHCTAETQHCKATIIIV